MPAHATPILTSQRFFKYKYNKRAKLEFIKTKPTLIIDNQIDTAKIFLQKPLKKLKKGIFFP